jgi:hypothetical protein
MGFGFSPSSLSGMYSLAGFESAIHAEIIDEITSFRWLGSRSGCCSGCESYCCKWCFRVDRAGARGTACATHSGGNRFGLDSPPCGPSGFERADGNVPNPTKSPLGTELVSPPCGSVVAEAKHAFASSRCTGSRRSQPPGLTSEELLEVWRPARPRPHPRSKPPFASLVRVWDSTSDMAVVFTLDLTQTGPIGREAVPIVHSL